MTNIAKGLFGGTPRGAKALQGFRPSGFSSSGLSGRLDGSTFRVTRSPELQRRLNESRARFSESARLFGQQGSTLEGLVPRLRASGAQFAEDVNAARGRLGTAGADIASLRPELRALRGQAGSLRDEVRGLRGEVRPGIGRATEQRIRALRTGAESARSRAVGNLREELSRRRVAGSSFAAREIGALESEFSQQLAMQEDQIRADAFEQEMAATMDLFGLEAGLGEQERVLLGDAFSIIRAEAENALQEAALVEGLNDQQASQLAQEAGLITAGFTSRIEGMNQLLRSVQQDIQQLNLEGTLAANMADSSSKMMLSSLLGQAEAFSAQDSQFTSLISSLAGSAASFFPNTAEIRNSG